MDLKNKGIIEKQIVYILFIISLCACQSKSVSKDGIISFTRTEHNFKEVDFKSDTECSFLFTNQGETPLLIHQVKTSCGCTVPEWPRQPIKPGKSDKIRIKYDADFPGVFHKTIKVYYNGEDSPVTLNIKGRVEFPEEIVKEKK